MSTKGHYITIVRDHYVHIRSIRNSLLLNYGIFYRIRSLGIIYISIRPSANIQFYLKIASYVY